MTNAKNKKSIKAISLLMAILFITLSFSGCGKKTEDSSTTDTTKKAVTTLPVTTEPATEVVAQTPINPLTGEGNYPEELVGNRSVLVSVENHPQARPQWGICSADIVWELLAEGGITRMLCMFADASRLPDKLGPTRSARHYFVEIAEGFDSIFVHFGQSPKGKEYLNAYGTANINGMYDGSAFSRDYSRNVDSEHTAYTTKNKIISAIDSKGYRTTAEDGKAEPFSFNAKAVSLPDGKCTSVSVPFSSDFTYKYTYDETNKVYLSSLNGTAFKDDNGKQQSFTNIIIVYASTTTIDSYGRISYDLSSGDGVYVSNGTYQNISWEKGDCTDIMKFTDEDGKELKLNPGRSYIALVPTKNQSQTTIS